MTMVGSTVHCFSCTCRACGQEVSTPDVECHTCHFRVCPGCTTDGICTSCVERCRPSDPPSLKKRQFRREWLLTRSWLRYEATKDKMWCIACQQYPQLGHSVPFVQGTSNFMLCTLKHHQRSGSHAVSLALWQSGGRVTSVIKTLPPHVLQGIMALFRTVYRILQRAGPLSHVEGDAELVSLNGGTIIPGHCSPFSAREVLRFISQPFRISQGLVIKESSFFSIASDSCTDRAAKKEELFYVRAVVDGVMATNSFSCQPLPSGTAPGIVTALKRAMAHADVDLDVWIRKLFFYCGDGASVVQGECGRIIRIIGDLQKEIAGYDVVVPYHASCHRCELAFKAAIASDHAFLDLLVDTLQSAALFWNHAPSRLKTLHALALALDAAFLKSGVLHTRRWCAFAADALRRMKRCYVIVVLGLREVHLSKAVHKEQRDALLFAPTNVVFLCGLFFMLDVVQALALMLKPVRTPVAILGSLGVCIYVPASRHWLISYSPIHLN